MVVLYGMQRWRQLLFIGLIYPILSSGVWAQSFVSGPAQTTLIELYTSQGCSSCPPAEKYLNSLKDDPRLWKQYIPLALHVDYWDYLGWKDKFALASNTLRQRHYAKVNAQRTIYTPAFFVNGQPWRQRFYNRDPLLTKQDSGILKVNLSGNQLSASFEPAASSAVAKYNDALVLNIAIAGMGFDSDIQAGEREGSQPQHEFVLLSHSQHRSNDKNWSLSLPHYQTKGANSLALIAWVSRQTNPTPLQAVGGYIE